LSEIVFFASLVLLAYTFVGYPVLIAAWARMRPRQVELGDAKPPVAIIVVAYNEEARIQRKIETCLAQDYPAERLRIVIASDGSTDGTADIVRACAERRVTWLPHVARRGKAACLNDAVASCDEEILVFTDARQMLNAGAVTALVENFADERIGAVSGELVFVQDNLTPFAKGVDAYWRYEKFIRRCEARVHSAPGVTGALYAIRRRCYTPISPATILDDVAIPMQAIRAGYRVVFESRAHAYDRPCQEPAQERARKVRTLAGNYQLAAMMPWVLSPVANPIFVQFVSHKMLRLIAPFAMLALLASSAVLAAESHAFALFLLAQLLVYAAPLASASSQAFARMKAVRVASAFVMLNWYAVLGMRQFLTRRDGHLWQTRAAAGDEGLDRSRR
jgi:poly-beta-1,6-N-acetyl-D-glucosamine synthase